MGIMFVVTCNHSESESEPCIYIYIYIPVQDLTRERARLHELESAYSQAKEYIRLSASNDSPDRVEIRRLQAELDLLRSVVLFITDSRDHEFNRIIASF